MSMTESDERALIVSSDGHAAAKMADYRPYIPSSWLDDFDTFLEMYQEAGALRTHDAETLLERTDPDVVASWVKQVLEPGRDEGVSDPQRRFVEMDQQGIVAEVLFPDFGLPFQPMSPLMASRKGSKSNRMHEQIEVGTQAHNRWLADFCSSAPDRFAGLASVSFVDVDTTIAEIRWAKDAGLRGIVLPAFEDDAPIFDPRFEPVWSVLEELEMPINSHTSISATTREGKECYELVKHVTRSSIVIPIIVGRVMFFCHELLTQLIWGGVLERHPKLQVVLTEQGSGWVISTLKSMDFRYEESYAARDLREIIPRKPSEYFRRQCHLGSSLFSKAEAEARHEIGIDKITIGADYPHHEGTWAAGPGTVEWLRATLGAAGVTPDEARLMLGANAIRLWGFDEDALTRRANTIGPSLSAVLTPPTEDWYPRGDVKKPIVQE
jgi:predicted TIM-barrel fold metal-dependent hydrolase